MTDWFERFEGVLQALVAHPEVMTLEAKCEREEFPIEPDYAEDVLAEGGFVLDEQMRSFFSQVREVDVVWTHAALGEHLVAGRLDVGTLDDIVFSGYDETDLKKMGPRAETEREFLTKMRHIDTHHCMGDHWLALCPRADGTPTYWWRTQVDGGTDVPLRSDFEGLLELMLATRGALSWPLLCADLEGLEPQVIRSLLHEPSGPAAGLRRCLELLREMQCDVTQYCEHLDDVVRASAEGLLQ